MEQLQMKKLTERRKRRQTKRSRRLAKLMARRDIMIEELEAKFKSMQGCCSRITLSKDVVMNDTVQQWILGVHSNIQYITAFAMK